MQTPLSTITLSSSGKKGLQKNETMSLEGVGRAVQKVATVKIQDQEGSPGGKQWYDKEEEDSQTGCLLYERTPRKTIKKDTEP